jgi:hypothetical protein
MEKTVEISEKSPFPRAVGIMRERALDTPTISATP